MTTIKIPTPLRAYTGGQGEIKVSGETVGAALSDLLRQHPDLRAHLYNGNDLRNFVNVFIGEEDIRYRDGLETPLEAGDNLRIIPSIAGGRAEQSQHNGAKDRRVDHSALRTNQAFIIGLLILAFVLDSWPVVIFVSAVMIVGTVLPSAGLFKTIYFTVLKPAGIARPDVKIDNPEPHLFAQGLGGVVTLAATLALVGGLKTLGWLLSWLVVGLASLNLFAGICIGCLVYYQLNRLGVPGFSRAPIRQ